jgi:hypothetical protein
MVNHRSVGGKVKRCRQCGQAIERARHPDRERLIGRRRFAEKADGARTIGGGE